MTIKSLLSRFPITSGIESECYKQTKEHYDYQFYYEARVWGNQRCYEGSDIVGPEFRGSKSPSSINKNWPDGIWAPKLPDPISLPQCYK